MNHCLKPFSGLYMFKAGKPCLFVFPLNPSKLSNPVCSSLFFLLPLRCSSMTADNFNVLIKHFCRQIFHFIAYIISGNNFAKISTTELPLLSSKNFFLPFNWVLIDASYDTVLSSADSVLKALKPAYLRFTWWWRLPFSCQILFSFLPTQASHPELDGKNDHYNLLVYSGS